MTVIKLGEKIGLKRLSNGPDREIASCYISDLLSRVLGGCQSGDVWITVQSSINMIAVAVMAEVGCVILPEGLTVTDQVADKANEEGLSIFTSKENAFSLAIKTSRLI